MHPVGLFAFSTERYIPNGMQRKFIEFNSPALRGGLRGAAFLSESGFSRHVLNVVNVLQDEQD